MQNLTEYYKKQDKEHDKIGFIFLGVFVVIMFFVIMPIISHYN